MVYTELAPRRQQFLRGASHVTIEQRCNQFDGYAERAVYCHDQLFRVAYDLSAVGLLGRREQRCSCHCEALRAHL